jgi:ATP-dependent Lon protease
MSSELRNEIRKNQRRRTKSGEAGPPQQQQPPPPDTKYNLRSKDASSGAANPAPLRWVDDDTLFDDPKKKRTSSSSSSAPSPTNVHGIQVPGNMPVSVKIHLHARVNAEIEDEDEDYEDEDEDEEEDDEEYEDDDEEDEVDESFLSKLLKHHLGGGGRRNRPRVLVDDEAEEEDDVPIKLYRKERNYFEDLSKKEKKKTIKQMFAVSELLGDTEVPYKFRVLSLDTSPKIQTEIIRKVDAMTRMGNESGETQKLRNWVDAILRVPFGKNIPLPVTCKDEPAICADFLKTSRTTLEKATYGMLPAKTQIMQILAQWISNPDSVGNCIAMKGPMGTGKTSFARNGIANVLKRPFMFFSLGGASDIAHYSGHSYTYEGSMWGRIIDAIMQAGCMNPVLYFDELDKISGTPHGEEITSMLIHLTDRSQNTQYHDRYFAGIDFDLSQCLFVFSFNDESKVHPVLKDRMSVIQCSGYTNDEKKIIVANYVWPEVLKHAGIKREDLSATEDAAEYIIREYSNGEQGMRNIIRVVETVVSRVNLLRLSDEESGKKYKFWTKIQFPLKLTKETVKTLLQDVDVAPPETWRSLYN